MIDLSVLKNLNPAYAGFIEYWKNKYEKKYDLSEIEQQALFYEGVLELARFLAKNNTQAFLKSEVCSQGFSEIKIYLS
jgi:hypothetical protein